MKTQFTLLALFITFSIYSQNQKATLFLKDSTTKEGYAKITSYQKIVFRKTKKDEKITYDYTSVKKLLIDSDGKDIEYVYKVIRDGPFKVMLIEPIIKGEINLFRTITSGTSSISMGNGMNFTNSGSKTTYFMSINSNDVAINLKIGNTYSKRFKKIAKKYFSDCPDLLSKIENKYFSRYDIRNVVEYYNNKCIE